VPEARELVEAGRTEDGRKIQLTPGAAAAWSRMRAAAEAAGHAIELVSGFRSVQAQAGIIERKLARGMSLESILRENAAPGFSEHHSGRAVDVAVAGQPPLTEAFAGTAAFAWLEANAPAFGFTLSYPRGNPHGISFEPWHWLFGRGRID
jgi:D-alanyl-D-alanine carboxypeptidase